MVTVSAAQNDEAMPAHIAIIMDGNGRWAKARGLLRAEGHRRVQKQFGVSWRPPQKSVPRI